MYAVTIYLEAVYCFFKSKKLCEDFVFFKITGLFVFQKKSKLLSKLEIRRDVDQIMCLKDVVEDVHFLYIIVILRPVLRPN